MENTSKETILAIAKAQKEYFLSGETLDIKFRKEMLRKLYKAMENWESRLCDALWADLHKSYEEAYLTELSIVTGEIKNHIKNVSSWAKRERRRSPLNCESALNAAKLNNDQGTAMYRIEVYRFANL